MFSFFKKRIICPYCLAEIRGAKTIKHCPKCKQDIPVRYVSEHNDAPPFFAQVFGWSQVGKTVYISALTLMLKKMTNVWPDYLTIPANDETQRKMQEIQEYLAEGIMPPMTDLGPQEVYIMVLKNIERWGGRTLVTRDCAGEIFDTMTVPVEQAPYLLNAPTTFMMISLADLDLPKAKGRTMDMLMNNYISTLMQNGIDFNKERRKLIIVLTKGDIIPNLPPNLRNYLMQDPLWAAVNSPDTIEQLDSMVMAEYMEIMERVSNFIRDWIQRKSSGKNLVRLAEDKNVDLRFSIISSTGAAVDADGSMPERLSPRRVLDPYFWALELQSR